jgi:hypothetical protein
LQSLSRQEIIEMVYDIKQVARTNAKLTQEARGILQQIIADPHVPQGVVAEAQEVLTTLAAETARPTRFIMGGVGGIVILILAFILLNSRADPPPTLTPNVPSITPSTAVTPETTLTLEAATLENLNIWREQNGYPLLVVNPILTDVADGQMRYLSTLPLPDLEATNLYLNADGRDAQWMVDNAGYNGEVQMFVAALPDAFTLADLLAKLEREGSTDLHNRYNEAGLASMRSEVTSVLYFVLILGQAG